MGITHRRQQKEETLRTMMPEITTLRILSMNCNSVVGKLNDIKCYVETLKPDLISITETKLGPHIDDNELFGDKFTVWRNDRNSHGGGVLVAINNDVNLNVISSKNGPGESITLDIQLHPKIKFNLITFYRPPNEYALENLIDIIETNTTENCLYLGDYNLPDLDWQSDPGKCKVKENSLRKSQHQLALDTIMEADLKQQISKPTHRCGNTLDLVMVNKSFLDDVTVECDILPPISDHNMILVDMKTQELTTNKSAPPRIFKDYKKANFDDIESIFFEFITSLENRNLDIEETWNSFTKCVEQALESIPGKLAKPNNNPWITRNIVRLIRKRCRVFKRNERFPSIANQAELDEICAVVKTEVHKAKSDYLKNHLCKQMEEGNSKPLFNYLNRHKGRSNNITSLKDSEPHEIPDTLAKHFAAVFSDTNLPTPTANVVKAYPKMEKIKIGRHGVELLLTKLDQRKAPGPDNVSGITIKTFALNCPSFVDCVCYIFRMSIKEGKVPSAWRQGIVRPIYKGGDRTDTNNYRPICLTSILAKSLEHILCSHMWQHINDYEIIKGNQHGFRKNLNTTTQLLHVIHKAAEAYDQHLDYHLISFDFSKAFDRVPHNLLLHKLRNYNFDVNCVSWIEDWLMDRTSVVSVNGEHSKEFSVRSGVPQGSVLGPLLFILYVNDMSDEIKNSECRLYADDTVLCSSVTDLSLLQHDVNCLFDWAKTWGMTFNPLKCCHMQVGTDTPTTQFMLGTDFIPVANSVKYLGVHIDSNLKWNNHITKITAKANRALGLIKRNLKEAPKKTKWIAFTCMVKPILEYASPVWSPYAVGLTNSLEKVQNNAIRWVYWLKKRDSITDCRNDHNISSLSIRRRELDILFLRKIEAGLFDVKLNNYIRFSTAYDTRGKSISWTQRTNAWKYSYYNRMRSDVKVYFPPT